MKRIMFVPADEGHIGQYNQFVNSVRKFHSEEELPILRVDTNGDPHFWYRAKPIIASDLIKEYETVIGADADQICLAPLTEIWEGEFDAGLVLNDQAYPIGVWDITHPNYFNNGLVVLKSKEFIDHWLRLCLSDHFLKYQFREQDILNILASNYFNYKIKRLEGQKLYGEVAKPKWSQFDLIDGKVMLNGQQLCMIHFGGGQDDPSKGNYRIRFKPEVVEFIEKQIK